MLEFLVGGNAGLMGLKGDRVRWRIGEDVVEVDVLGVRFRIGAGPEMAGEHDEFAVQSFDGGSKAADGLGIRIVDAGREAVQQRSEI